MAENIELAREILTEGLEELLRLDSKTKNELREYLDQMLADIVVEVWNEQGQLLLKKSMASMISREQLLVSAFRAIIGPALDALGGCNGEEGRNS